jgi:hypothetical protein
MDYEPARRPPWPDFASLESPLCQRMLPLVIHIDPTELVALNTNLRLRTLARDQRRLQRTSGLETAEFFWVEAEGVGTVH